MGSPKINPAQIQTRPIPGLFINPAQMEIHPGQAKIRQHFRKIVQIQLHIFLIQAEQYMG